FKCDFPTFPVSVGDFVLQKISENIIENWVETEHKNKIKEARDQGIAPPPKRKNAIPPTSRFKKKPIVQSPVTNSDIAETDDESDARSITSYKNNFSRQNSITSTNTNIPDDDTPESSTITSHAIGSSSSFIPNLLPANFNAIEVDSSEDNNDNDVSEPSTITLRTTRPSRSSIPTRLLATRSSNTVEVDNSKVDNNVSGLPTPIQRPTRSLLSSRFSTRLSATSSTTTEVDNSNDVFEKSTITPRTSGSSKIQTRFSAGSNTGKIDGSINTQSSALPLSPLKQNGNNIKNKRTRADTKRTSKKRVVAKNKK
ncbi:2298_t:CDS:2, partial [Cetraspora pellucida]